MAALAINQLAAQLTPHVDVKVDKQAFRHNVVDQLHGEDNVGIELGVAKGIFSKRMVDSGKFRSFFGVDLYGDHHDTAEYAGALKYVGLDKPYKLLRMSFDDSLALFDDDTFDFIYFDGYAHTGEEGGKTFADWYDKVKVGGIIAGDDYHDDWPLVKWAVNTLVKKLDVELTITGRTETTNLSRYPTWYFRKKSKNGIQGVLDQALLNIGQNEKQRVAARIAQRNTENQMSVEQILRYSDFLLQNAPHLIGEFDKIIAKHRM